MGIELKPRNIKWDDKTEQQVIAIQEFFRPMCATRSATVRLAIDRLHMILMTPSILRKVEEGFQELQSKTSYLGVRTLQFPSEEEERPGPMKANGDRGISDRTGTNSARGARLR